MIDPKISLAFSIYSNKGAYALLLGSGISRSCGVPTGWEIVLDLVRKVAKLEGEDCDPNPAEWFMNKFGVEPDYSGLIDIIAKSPTERQQFLRAYFEPISEEQEQSLKSPGAAHKAVAQLVASGYIRVILTTNFDRLIERALEEIGIPPTVISTPDQIMGALPLVHSGVTVVKLNGDYLDTRIKNTALELATYDDGTNRLLDRILDEYGLVVCGWSAEWDAGLRAAIERCPSRRFTTFWAVHSGLSEAGHRLAQFCKAELIQIPDANHFFEDLWENVRTLNEMNSPHPLSAKMAIATVKRYLVDPAASIRLHDLVYEETEKLVIDLGVHNFPGEMSERHTEELVSRMKKYEALCETLCSIISVGCYWGVQQQTKLWISSLDRLGNQTYQTPRSYQYLTNLRLYPALLVFYCAGIASMASRNYHTLYSLFLEAKARLSPYNKKEPYCSLVYPIAIVDEEIFKKQPGMAQSYTPISDHLFRRLRPIMKELLPDDDVFENVFDKFEYLLGLVHADLNREGHEGSDYLWGPFGSFVYKRRFPEANTPKQIEKELQEQGANWLPLKAGLFGGSLERANLVRTKYGVLLSRLNIY